MLKKMLLSAFAAVFWVHLCGAMEVVPYVNNIDDIPELSAFMAAKLDAQNIFYIKGRVVTSASDSEGMPVKFLRWDDADDCEMFTILNSMASVSEGTWNIQIVSEDPHGIILLNPFQERGSSNDLLKAYKAIIGKMKRGWWAASLDALSSASRKEIASRIVPCEWAYFINVRYPFEANRFLDLVAHKFNLSDRVFCIKDPLFDDCTNIFVKIDVFPEFKKIFDFSKGTPVCLRDQKNGQ